MSAIHRYTTSSRYRPDLPRESRTMRVAAFTMVSLFVLFTVLAPAASSSLYSTAKNFITTDLNWYYILFVSLLLLFALGLIFSPFGRIRLGRDDERPEFGNFTWFAMLFSAAIGTGLMFWSIAEPISHLQSNPFASMAGVDANTAEAAQIALRITIFHWGIHGWAVYIVTGMILAYFAYRRGLPLTIRSTLYPLLGERIHGPIGHFVDLLAVFCTLFGTATTLGLGVSQMSAGMSELFGTASTLGNQLMLITLVSVIAIVSVVTGLRKGILILSKFNIYLSVLFFFIVFVAGPSLYLIGLFTTSLGDYLSHALQMGFWVNQNVSDPWQGWWTLFYWGWWLSWGPYVGMFVARISRGRTVRELLIGGIGLACLGSMIWIVIFGGTALHQQIYQGVDLAAVVNADLSRALFSMLQALDVGWLGTLLTLLATLMIVSWFVTSADSCTLVICTLLARGNPNPKRSSLVIWGAGLGTVAAVLLASGGLEALQTAAIVSALPFSFVLLFMCVAVVKAMREEFAPSPVLAEERR